MSFNYFRSGNSIRKCLLKSLFIQILVLPLACKNACHCVLAFLTLKAAALAFVKNGPKVQPKLGGNDCLKI